MKLTIDDVGAQGDGISHVEGRAVFVPFTLSGETVEVTGDAPRYDLASIVKASPERVEPPCPHFGTCGGCSLQHMAQAPYLAWKRQQVVDAFAKENLEPVIGDCVATSLHSRRRVTFTAHRDDDSVKFGFNQRGSHELVDIDVCSILRPEIAAHLDAFKHLCTVVMRGREDVQLSVTFCDNGLDLDFALEQDLSESMTADFVHAFAKTPFIRSSANGDILVERERPIITFGEAFVPVPAGGFLQAVGGIENEMASLVGAHLKKKKRIVDLYSGSGTFSLRLAKKARVHAVETEQASLDALLAGASTASLKPVTTEQRDLDEAPLSTKELSRFDAVCLDPPRAGALEQVRVLANSEIEKIAYVSCNPHTLARDAAVLIKSGYEFASVTPLDQFLFSPHVEVVALFQKQVTKQKPIFGRKV